MNKPLAEEVAQLKDKLLKLQARQTVLEGLLMAMVMKENGWSMQQAYLKLAEKYDKHMKQMGLDPSTNSEPDDGPPLN